MDADEDFLSVEMPELQHGLEDQQLGVVAFNALKRAQNFSPISYTT